jgi:selenoprotein W-related protein
MAELLKSFEPDIQSFTLLPSDGGRFEMMVNGKLLYSKLQTGRHSEPGEVRKLVNEFLKEDQ